MTVKKYIRSFMLLTFCALLLLGLAACKEETEPPYEPESASALWAKVDETMNALQSYEMSGDVKVVFYSMGYKFKIDGITSTIFTTESMYTEAVTEVACAELSTSQTMNRIEAYHDGKMYLATSDGTHTQKFSSPITKDEYADFKTDDLAVIIDIEDCTSAEYSKGEGETWNLEFSGYTKKTIDQMLESLNLTEEQLGTSIADMKVSLTADTEFRVKEITVAFDFTASEDMGAALPEFAVTCKYSAFNETQFDASKLNAAEFTEIPDVRLLENVADAIQKRQESTSGHFLLDHSTTYEFQGQVDTSVENDLVSYGKNNGAYYYAIDAFVDDERFIMRYQNGAQTVEINGQTQTAIQSEQEAKSFIDGLINSAGYDPNAVTGVEKVEEGTFLLKVDSYDTSLFDATIQAMEMELTAATQQITVTLKDGNLTKIHSKAVISGTAAGETVTITMESNVNFESLAFA